MITTKQKQQINKNQKERNQSILLKKNINTKGKKQKEEMNRELQKLPEIK